MRGTPPPQKTAEQMLIDKIKSLELELRESSELNEHLRERIRRLEEAGDEMAQEYRGKLGFDNYDELLLNRWTKAKEAKP